MQTVHGGLIYANILIIAYHVLHCICPGDGGVFHPPDGGVIHRFSLLRANDAAPDNVRGNKASNPWSEATPVACNRSKRQIMLEVWTSEDEDVLSST